MSMFGLSFLTPIALLGLLLLPLLYWLLRVRPPQPNSVVFPPLQLLKRLKSHDQEARTSPLWLLILRLVLFTLLVLVAAQPFLGKKQAFLNGTPPLIALDDTWAAAHDWDTRLQTAKLLLEDAVSQNLTVRLMTTASPRLDPALRLNANQALERLSGLKPVAQARDVEASITRLNNAGLEPNQVQVFWLSDGLQDAPQNENNLKLASSLTAVSVAPMTVFSAPQADLPISIAAVNARSGGIDLQLSSLSLPRPVTFDLKNEAEEVLISSEFDFTSDNSQHALSLPANLLAQVSSIELRGQRHAGAKWLLAGNDKRYSVAVISGSGEKSQPLLTPSHYLTSAFSTDIDLIPLSSTDVESAVLDALARSAESLILNGTGPLPASLKQPLLDFIDKGGVLIRFADKALANEDDGLLPASPHANLRLFGGQLSWGDLPTIDSYAQNAPLQAVNVDKQVRFRAQLLLQTPEQGRVDVLASLSDGTPFVSLKRQGDGALVFVHVDADPVWSNMMSSPSFAQIIPALARLSSFKADASNLDTSLRAPFKLMDGFGTLQSINDTALAVDFSQALPFNARPGLYGSNGATALNLLQIHTNLAPQRFDQDATRISQRGYPNQTGRDLMPLLLLIASALFLADCLASLVLSGRLNWLRFKNITPLVLAISMSALLLPPPHAQAQTEPWQAALSPRLGYILTEDAQIDDISRAGMEGLSSILSARTSLELDEPVGLRLDGDELGFFPFVYWAVAPNQIRLNDQERRNLNRFLSSGGTILIDTRDEAAMFGASDFNAGQLRALLEGVNVPALAPVADNHVLTRSFYLIESFPGRFGDTTLWAESIIDTEDRLTRTGDGVSSVMVTNGDLAGAWALDQFGRPLLPVTPNGELQREYAYRAGVNMVLYAFTGNYKADQVHIPVIMERLGQ